MTTRTSGPARGASDTPARIQAAALRRFAQQGFERTSLRQIADDLELTKAALYYHYRSKDDLVVALLEPAVVETEILLTRLARPTGDGDARLAAERDALADYLDLLLRHRPLIAWLLTDTASLLHSSAGERLAPLFSRVQDVIAGTDAPLASRVRVAAAIGALRSAVIAFPDAAEDELRETVLTAGLAVLDALDRAPAGSTR